MNEEAQDRIRESAKFQIHSMSAKGVTLRSIEIDPVRFRPNFPTFFYPMDKIKEWKAAEEVYRKALEEMRKLKGAPPIVDFEEDDDDFFENDEEAVQP